MTSDQINLIDQECHELGVIATYYSHPENERRAPITTSEEQWINIMDKFLKLIKAEKAKHAMLSTILRHRDNCPCEECKEIQGLLDMRQ